MIYGSSLSWVTPAKPATKEIYPSRAFDRLIGDGTGRKLDRSILDAVRDDTQSLRAKISREDNEDPDEKGAARRCYTHPRLRRRSSAVRAADS